MCSWFCVSAWAHLQLALTSSETKLLSRIPTAGILETETQERIGFLRFSMCVPMRSTGRPAGRSRASRGGFAHTRPVQHKDLHQCRTSPDALGFRHNAHICRYSDTHLGCASERKEKVSIQSSSLAEYESKCTRTMLQRPDYRHTHLQNTRKEQI